MTRTRVAALLFSAIPELALAAAGTATAPVPQCTGEYADVLGAMRPEIRRFEASPDASYTYCVRTVATYEHLSYGRGGTVRKQYIRHVRHGTAFAYRTKGGETYIATNEHVVEHPEVTEEDGEVDGVPAGSRKVREVVRIVRSESDDYEPGQIPLTKVIADEGLDVAVLKTPKPLRTMPYRIGRSSALKVGNAVQVRGYPLGAFAAANSGRVINTSQPDREHGWNHEDFALDALLNSGNSGSPVFAVSCRTGELELVGIYHAGFRDAQGLNVAVAVDQLRDLLLELKAPRRDPPEPLDRATVLADLRRAGRPFVMPFGERVVEVELEGETVRFSLLDPDYPLSAAAQFRLVDREDRPAASSSLVLPARFGDEEIPWSGLDDHAREPVRRLREALWRQLVSVLQYRAAEAQRRDPDSEATLAQLAATLQARRAEQRDLIASLEFESDEITWPRSAAAIAGAPPDGASSPGTRTAAGGGRSPPGAVIETPTPRRPGAAAPEGH